MIPKQLQNPEFRFNLVIKKEKLPIEKNWSTINNYSYNHPKLIKHLSNQGNYGVLGGYGNLLIVDCDKEETWELVKNNLPNTFMVKASKLPHSYYYCENGENLKVLDDNKETLADIQFKGRFVVAPGSIHPSGIKYQVIEDVSIAEIDFNIIKNLFKPYEKNIPINIKNGLNDKEVDPLLKEIKTKINFQEILKNYDIDIKYNPTNCPLHSSQRNKCFSYTNETFNCFHCGWKGNIFHFVMKMEKCNFITAKKILGKFTEVIQ